MELGLQAGVAGGGQGPAARRREYRKDLVYGSCTTMVMDRLRDRVVFGEGDRRHRDQADRLRGAQRPERLMAEAMFAIADRADVLLCDAAATTVVLSDRPDATEREQLAFQALGTAAQLELLRAAAAFQDARAQSASATARLSLAERALARVMGSEPTRIAGVAPVLVLTVHAASHEL